MDERVQMILLSFMGPVIESFGITGGDTMEYERHRKR